MPKTKTKITQEIEAVPNQDDSPNVVAFRVGLLEKQLDKRFDTFEAKLDQLGGSFVSIETIEQLKKDAEEQHLDFHRRITRLERLMATYPVVKNIVFGAVGLTLTAVFGAIIALVVTK